MRLHQGLDQIQPQASPLSLPVERTVHPMEPLEDPLFLSLRDADPLVGHVDRHLVVVEPPTDPNGATVRRVLDGVANQVGKDLSDALLIRGHQREVLREVNQKAMLVGLEFVPFHQPPGQPRQVHLGIVQRQCPGLDARDVQQVVDQLVEPVALLLDHLEQRTP